MESYLWQTAVITKQGTVPRLCDALRQWLQWAKEQNTTHPWSKNLSHQGLWIPPLNTYHPVACLTTYLHWIAPEPWIETM